MGGEGLAVGVWHGFAGLPRVPAASAERLLKGQEDFDVSHALGITTDNNEYDNSDNDQMTTTSKMMTATTMTTDLVGDNANART